jgi:hypothetical protein
MAAHTPATLDHLVVMASTLEEGSAWCQATLGVPPGPGGQHPLMGTHNRLLAIATPAFTGAYLEIIALDPQAVPRLPAGHRRWFDMELPALRQHVATHGPALIHWVARVPRIQPALDALQQLGLDNGPALAASRPTPEGELRWQISVRPDGQRLLGGAVPTLIEWGDRHPTDRLPPSPVRLTGWRVQHPQAPVVSAALAAIGLPVPHGVAVAQGLATLQATLDTPRGPVVLSSPFLHPPV